MALTGSRLSCDQLNSDLAVLLLDSGAVSVFSPEEAQRLLVEHRSPRPSGSPASDVTQMAVCIFARKAEYGLSGHLKGRSCNQAAQMSAIRSAICLVAESVLRVRPAVEVGSTGVEETSCGLDLAPYELVTA